MLHGENDTSLVLIVGFQVLEYTVLEDSDLSVCLTITGGVLVPGLSVSASLSTSPGNTAGEFRGQAGMSCLYLTPF